MLRFICVNIVKATAVIVCIGVGVSACLFPGRDARYDDRRESHEGHHDEHHDEHREEHH
jgi:hypothetical protein